MSHGRPIVNGMDVRPCAERDLAALSSRWPSPADVHSAHFAAQRDGRSTYLVAWEGDEPVGAVMVQWAGCVGPNACAAYPGAVEFNHLQVRDSWRGRGVGSRLIRTAEATAKNREMFQVAVGVADDNAGAQRLYVRLGYGATGVFDVSEYDWVADDGSVRHEVERNQLLVKTLGSASDRAAVGNASMR